MKKLAGPLLPELSAADVKLRVEAAMKQLQGKGTCTIE